MITLQDCLGFIDLDEDALRAIAVRYRLPDVIAAQQPGMFARTARECGSCGPAQGTDKPRGSRRSSMRPTPAGPAAL
jgi:hypothetical protein